MNDTMSLAEREQQVYAKISKKLIDTGEKERIKEWLLAMLEESGWKDQLKKDCLQYAQEHASSSTSETASTANGKKVDEASVSPFKDVSLEGMLSALLSKSKDAVPLHIKVELLNRLRTFFLSKESALATSASATSTHL
jgi:hypothetical protein